MKNSKKRPEPEPKRYTVNVSLEVEIMVAALDRDGAVEAAFDDLSIALGGVKIKKEWWNKVEEETEE